MERHAPTIESGTRVINKKYAIIVDTKGPYFVYGTPPLQQEFIIPNEQGEAWKYQEGLSYKLTNEPAALCRCGHTHTPPFCDGTHSSSEWDPTLKADHKPLLEEAKVYDGPELQLSDNPKYCVHARFCLAKGNIWKAVAQSDQEEYKALTIHESFHCPSGRLKINDKLRQNFIEPEFQPSISLIEDPQKNCSGPLWVKGGIPMQDSECNGFETRNRFTLCRCGTSDNKPYCDGTHLKNHYQDGLPPLKKQQ